MEKRAIPKHITNSTRKWVKSVLLDYQIEDSEFNLLILAAETLDRANAARAVVDKLGLTCNNRYGEIRTRPEVTIERDCKDLYRRLLRELNLSETPEESRPPRLGYGGK